MTDLLIGAGISTLAPSGDTSGDWRIMTSSDR